MAFTMTLHNLPEGFAVAFSAYTDFGPVMAAAIAVHNIPEGVIVSAPVYAATGSRCVCAHAHACLSAGERACVRVRVRVHVRACACMCARVFGKGGRQEGMVLGEMCMSLRKGGLPFSWCTALMHMHTIRNAIGIIWPHPALILARQLTPRWRALAVATASGLSEPLGALLALLLVKPYLTGKHI
jgi:hypothetical protein